MKKLLFLLIFLSTVSYAQQLTPFVTEGNTWLTKGSPEPNVVYYHDWKISGDTIVNGIPYKKIYQYGALVSPGLQGLQGCLRQVGKKVYYKPVFPSESELCDTTEILLYNFDPIQDDSISFWRCGSNPPIYLSAPLESFGISSNFGADRKYFSYFFGGAYDEVGSEHSPLYPLNIFYEAIPIVVCFNGFPKDTFSNECISSIPIVRLDQDFWTDNPLQQNTLNVHTTQAIASAGYQVSLVNISGKTVYTSAAQIKDLHFEAHIDQPMGMYFLVLRTAKGIGTTKVVISN